MRSYLIVDDNKAFAENLAEIVADSGAGEAVVADSADRALELVRARRFDALVSDMRMPLMNGAELVHQIRGIDPGLPAIVVTAYTADTDLDPARRQGLLAVLAKPVPMLRLIELLRRARRNGLVALVEDDVALADNLSEALRAHGFAAVTARSVIDTEGLRDIAPFAALVDLRVPGGSDGEAMRRLAAKFPGLPMMVVSGYDVLPPLPHVGFFSKPFDTPALLAAVEHQYYVRHG